MNRSNLKQAAVFVDADNTLWDTDSVYANAQLWLLSAVEAEVGANAPTGNRLAYLREIDQGLAERHHAGLRYPPCLLVKALALAFSGASLEAAIRLAWAAGPEVEGISELSINQLEQQFLTALLQVPELRPGVRIGLEQLSASGHTVIMVTEGSRERASDISKQHGLHRFFECVVEARKTRQLFERLLQLTELPHAAFMVGDQLERDVRPAQEAGVRTIFFPGGFRPKWERSELTVRPDYCINTFIDVPTIINGVSSQTLVSV